MKFIFFSILVFFLLIIGVNGFAVVSEFLTNNTLEIREGTSKSYTIWLQNVDEGEVQVSVTYDTDRAKIYDYPKDGIYTVGPKSDRPIYINVSALNSKPSDSFVVSYTVHQLTGGGGGLSFLLKINKNFKVKVTEDPNKSKLSAKYIVLGIIILLIIAVSIYRKFAGKKNKDIKKRISATKKGKGK